MKIEKNSLEQILSLDDTQFESIVREVATACGANRLKTNAICSDIGGLKRKIASLSPEEAQGMIGSAGEENSRRIYEALRERGIDLGR